MLISAVKFYNNNLLINANNAAEDFVELLNKYTADSFILKHMYHIFLETHMVIWDNNLSVVDTNNRLMPILNDKLVSLYSFENDSNDRLRYMFWTELMTHDSFGNKISHQSFLRLINNKYGSNSDLYNLFQWKCKKLYVDFKEIKKESYYFEFSVREQNRIIISFDAKITETEIDSIINSCGKSDVSTPIILKDYLQKGNFDLENYFSRFETKPKDYSQMIENSFYSSSKLQKQFLNYDNMFLVAYDSEKDESVSFGELFIAKVKYDKCKFIKQTFEFNGWNEIGYFSILQKNKFNRLQIQEISKKNNVVISNNIWHNSYKLLHKIDNILTPEDVLKSMS